MHTKCCSQIIRRNYEDSALHGQWVKILRGLPPGDVSNQTQRKIGARGTESPKKKACLEDLDMTELLIQTAHP